LLDFLWAPALHPSRSPASPNHAATMVRSSSATSFSSSTNFLLSLIFRLCFDADF
jgi:hypothetical protein